ncbi:hypothetical protein [Paraburkholderia strydomiana]|uniref:hypothetical protein n=1 Tax=Paraburkholderia strydomiana TaxID=1245417 RepID=UPI001BEC1F80|nr:hypothetical protein [Paraburkholderia strydomiana]MBT2793556.1 hypothetical protein [Paraburkholderia strydomiana]
MDIIELARASGLQIILDGRIGREEYRSVCGSVDALLRFADAINSSVRMSAPTPGVGTERTIVSLRQAAAARLLQPFNSSVLASATAA